MATNQAIKVFHPLAMTIINNITAMTAVDPYSEMGCNYPFFKIS